MSRKIEYPRSCSLCGAIIWTAWESQRVALVNHVNKTYKAIEVCYDWWSCMRMFKGVDQVVIDTPTQSMYDGEWEDELTQR